MGDSRDVQAYKQKDMEEKVKAFNSLLIQYPELEEMKGLIATKGEDFRAQYPVILTKIVSDRLDIPMSGVDILGGKPYINKTGLTHRIQKDPRRVKAIKSVPILLPIAEINVVTIPKDADFEKYFLGNSTDGTAIFQGIVEFEDGSRFEDQGTANAKYLNSSWGKMKTMIPYVIELASTRSINRAMRLATGIGLVSVEEINERGYDLVQESAASDISLEKMELIQDVANLFVKLRFNDAKKLVYMNKHLHVPALEAAADEKLRELSGILRGELEMREKNKKKKELENGVKGQPLSNQNDKPGVNQ